MNNEAMQYNIVPHFVHIVNRLSTPAWRINTSVHRHHNIILIYEGEAVFGCNGQELKATRGNIVYFKPGDLRFGYTFPNNPMKCFAVDFMYTCPIYIDNRWEALLPDLPFNSFDKIDDELLLSRLLTHFDELSKHWLSGGNNKIVHCKSIFSQIMLLMLDWKNGYNRNYDKTRKVEKVINFMTNNYFEKLTLQDLARVIGVSPSYLGSIFREITGKSPIDYLISIRLSKAKELIADGRTISDTASTVGFSDIFYFSKYFKKNVGMTPTLYSELHKNNL